MSDILIPFGRYRDCDLRTVALRDPDYLDWLEAAADKEPTGAAADFVEWFGDDIAQARQNAITQRLAKTEPLILSDSQMTAKLKAVDMLLNQHRSTFRLEGGAGYGKTAVTQEIARTALERGYKVNACAPSHVATDVLQQRLDPLGIKTATIASTFALDKFDVEDQEEYRWGDRSTEKARKILSAGSVLIVDEASMVPDWLARAMLYHAAEEGGQILIVGDPYQLPPVDQSDKSILVEDPSISSVVLTEPMRFAAGSDLHQVEQTARYVPQDIDPNLMPPCDSVIAHPNIRAMINAYVDDIGRYPMHDARMLFHLRRHVIDANNFIRANRWGGDLAQTTPVMEDERIMVTRTMDFQWSKNDEKTRFYSGVSYHVESVEYRERCGVICPWVKFHGMPGEWPVIFCLGHDANAIDIWKVGGPEYLARISSLRDQGVRTRKWGEFRQFKNAFIPVGYAYAMTVHRCQGQTVDRCYFAPHQLRNADVSDQLIYVAATRASRELHLSRQF